MKKYYKQKAFIIKMNKMVQNKHNSKLFLSLILITILITPTISVSAKRFKKHDSIEEHIISENVIRFEEKIILNIPPEYGMELPEGAYYKVNIYGIDVGDGVVLIDCGDEDYVKNLYKSVRKAFKKPVIAVYLTHGHADHAGGGAYFQRKGIPVYSHSFEVPFIEAGASDPAYPAPDQFLYTGFTPDYNYTCAEEEEGFSIIHTPGHTMGSVSIKYESDGGSYLFTGDTIFEKPSPDPLDFSFTLSWYTAYQLWELSNTPGYPDFIGTWQMSVNHLGMIVPNADTVCPGHGADYPSAYAPPYLGLTSMILDALPYPPV